MQRRFSACARTASAPASGGEAETLAFSHWNIPERWEVVKKGLRNPGQQVVEFVLLSRTPLSADEARDKFAAIVPELVEAEAEKLKR